MKKNKILAAVAAIGLAVSSLPFASASAASDSNSGRARWDLNGSTMTFSGSGLVYLDAIEKQALKNTIQHIVIKDGCGNIKDDAFSGLNVLCSLRCESDDTKSIGKNAFRGDKTLTTVEFVYGVEKLGDSAFYGCNFITSINLPSSLKKQNMARNAFSEHIPFTNFYVDENSEAYYYLLSNVDDVKLGKNIFIQGDANNDGRLDVVDANVVYAAIARPSLSGLYGSKPDHITAQGIKNANYVTLDGMTNLTGLYIQEKLLNVVQLPKHN